MMKSVILFISIFLLGLIEVRGQSRLETLISEANNTHKNGQHSLTLIKAHEAYNLALSESQKLELCRASLLLSESYRELGQYTEAMEFGLRCQSAARPVSKEYYAAASMSLINVFRSWGAWEKELEYIEQLSSESDLGESIQFDLLELKATCLYKLGRLEESSVILNELITHHREKGDLINAASKILDIALIERKRGNSTSAIMYLMTLTTPEYAGLSTSTFGIVENNIGELYMQQGKFNLAEEHLLIASKNIVASEPGYALVYLNLSSLKYRENKFDQAMLLLEKSIIKNTTSNDWHNLSVAQSLRAKILSATGDFAGAMEAANIALNAAEKSEEIGLLKDVYSLVVSLQLQSGDDEQARETQTKVDETTRSINEFSRKQNLAHQELVEIISKKEKSILSSIAASELENQRLESELASAKLDKDMSALKYEKELQAAALENEQVAKEKAVKELALVQAALMSEQQRYTIVELEKARTKEQLKISQLSNERAEKERGIELLKKENELLNSEQQRKDLEIQKDAALKKSGIAILVFVSILLIIVALALLTTKRKNKEIKEKQEAISVINHQLKEQHEEITSSIVFAKNFQEMIIPNEESFRECMPNSFLIYQPMDIVSGDIPFILNSEEKLYIGAIDCTGHGVPAAMQSFMAYYNLNEIILEFPEETCAEKLHRLHQKLMTSTKKSDEERNFTSGIDIGLCCIDKKEMTLEFAGANQPLILLKNDGVERIQGDRFTVGDSSFKKTMNLANHTRKLAKGDRFYLFSDGFIHQFGGLEGKKKFSMKRLMHEIHSQKDSAHSKAKQHLEESIRVWKGQCDQTDDIMLIGIEINESIISK